MRFVDAHGLRDKIQYPSVSSQVIHFGTSGWRGVIAEDFTFAGGRRVARTDRTDGLRLTFDDGEWVLIRPSGTEPLVRIYTESGSAAKSRELAEEARVWITQ